MTTSKELVEELQKAQCRCTEEHGQLIGGTNVTGPMAYYPKQMAMKIAGVMVDKKM